jgi:hypothetical protein
MVPEKIGTLVPWTWVLLATFTINIMDIRYKNMESSTAFGGDPPKRGRKPYKCLDPLIL